MSGESGTSVKQLEAEIAATRERLAQTIDELAQRAQPKELARRQAESAKVAFAEATRAEDGSLRTERIAGALGATSALLILLGLVRRRRS